MLGGDTAAQRAPPDTDRRLTGSRGQEMALQASRQAGKAECFQGCQGRGYQETHAQLPHAPAQARLKGEEAQACCAGRADLPERPWQRRK